jgi:hypothetical protein
VKILRGPQSNAQWWETDSKKPAEYIDAFMEGLTITLDGTIEKQGSRHTVFGLTIEDDDVVALSHALFRRYKKKQAELESSLKKALSELKKSEAKLEKLEEVLFNIWSLIEVHSAEAPSQGDLLKAVRTIANHDFSSKAVPKLGWIKWSEI